MLFVICLEKPCLLPRTGERRACLRRCGRLWKLTGKPGAGCECWSKAGWTNVCTHTSSLSPAARGDVKHDDVVGARGGAARSLPGRCDTHRGRRTRTQTHKGNSKDRKWHQKVVTLWQSAAPGTDSHSGGKSNKAAPSTWSMITPEGSPVFRKHR